MTVYTKEFVIETYVDEVTYGDITQQVKEAVEQSGIQVGMCLVVTAHTTCAVFFEEYTHDVDENGTELLQLDLNDGLEKIFPLHLSAASYRYPGEEHYREVESWPDHEQWLPNGDRSLLWNGDAHLKATLLGASETFAVVGGQLAVGKTGYVYFVDFDRTRERTRKYRVVIMGE